MVQNIFAKAEDVGSISEPTPVLLPGQSHGQRSLADDPGIELGTLALQADSLPAGLPSKPLETRNTN